MHILSAVLMSGKTRYRASIKRGELGAIIVVEQPFNNGERWGRASGWYLSTLMDRPSDSIYIDHGQNWKVDSGMLAVINEACLFLAEEWQSK